MEPLKGPTEWSIDRSKPKPDCVRTKNGVSVQYVLGKLLGFGERSNVYDLIPQAEGKKCKAIKITSNGNLSEYPLLMKINANGPVTGIVKAPKACVSKKAGDTKAKSMMIMPKYRDHLFNMIVGKQLTEREIVEGLKQIVQGLQYLKEHEIYHGDINSHNIFVGRWKGKLRFDIADFEFGAELSKFQTQQQLQCRLDRVTGHWAKLRDPSDVKQSFFAVDAGFFGLLLKDLSNILLDGQLQNSIRELGSSIMETKTLDGVMKRLDELESLLPSLPETSCQRV